MKKQVRLISTILVVMIVIASLTTTVFGTQEAITTLSTPGDTGNAGTQLLNLGKNIVGIMQIVGVVVAVVVLLILFIKYMVGSAEEKAEYKKTMIPYVVGAILLFAATTLVNVIYNLVTGLNNGV